MTDDRLSDEMAQRVAVVSREMQGLLYGLGHQIQGAVLADLVSMWIAGTWDIGELRGGFAGPLTTEARAYVFKEWIELVTDLIPESERELMQHVHPQGTA
jgi:hypothetical protein